MADATIIGEGSAQRSGTGTERDAAPAGRMREAPGSRLAPRRRSRPLIALTPLVDVVFLLLTFFMLSSNLSPFGLLPFGAARATAESETTSSADSRADLFLSVGAGTLRLGGTAVPIADLAARLSDARAKGAERLAILTAADATVQDLVAALDAARAAAFPSIDLASFR